jgi:hypothetical protein
MSMSPCNVARGFATDFALALANAPVASSVDFLVGFARGVTALAALDGAVITVFGVTWFDGARRCAFEIGTPTATPAAAPETMTAPAIKQPRAPMELTKCCRRAMSNVAEPRWNTAPGMRHQQIRLR